MKEKIRTDLTIPTYPIFVFINVLYEIDKIINVKMHLSHMKYGFVDFCLCLFPFN